MIDREGPGRLLIAGMLAAGLGACDGREEADPGRARPNIVFISIDSLRADHLGCYGHEQPTSPFIDQLASEGVLFEDVSATTSWTLPSHAAMFTGLHDSAHGVTNPTQRLAEAHVTLAESLAGVGYRTAGFYGGPYLHPVFGLDQGFEVWESCMADVQDTASREAVLDAVYTDEAAAHGDITGPRTLAAVEAWSKHSDARPFFLFVHLWDVHHDYLAPQSYVDLFDPGYEGPVDGLDVEQITFERGKARRPHLRHLLALYDAEIRFTDDIVRDLLGALRGRGMLENTLVVLTSDHGDEFLEHGGIGHLETLYEEVLRVPLILHWPGELEAGRAVEQPVSLVSLAPTLLALAGVDERPATTGLDLSPLLAGGELPPRPAYSELLLEFPTYALRTGDLKVIYEPGPRPKVEAFDLARDPGEKERLEGTSDPRIADAVQYIEARISESRESAANAGLDPELRQRLESLGYLDGASEEP